MIIKQPTTIRTIIHHARTIAADEISSSVISVLVSLPIFILLRTGDGDTTALLSITGESDGDTTGLLAITGEGDGDTTGLLAITGEGDGDATGLLAITGEGDGDATGLLAITG
jgi:hypothetical protein